MSASNAISSSRKGPARGARPRDSSSSTAERFTLSGPSLELDPRVHAYRRDIADIALAGVLFAPHYARPAMRRCGRKPAALRTGPSAEAEQLALLRPGEEFALLDLAGDWAWGYRRVDHLVGYVEAAGLDRPAPRN